MKKGMCRILSVLLSAGLLLTGCGDTVTTNNTQPNKVTIEMTEGGGTQAVTDVVIGDETGTDTDAMNETNSGTADGDVLGAYDFGNFIMLPAEYNYNWTSRVVMPLDAKLKINVATNLVDLVKEPNTGFVDITYNIDAACKKRITSNDLTLAELLDGVGGNIFDKRDVIYYYLVFLTDEQGKDLAKPYVLPITIADVVEVPEVVFTTDKCLRFSDTVEVMPISKQAVGSDTEAMKLIDACEEYMGIIPITVSYFDDILAGQVKEITQQDLKYYAKNGIGLVYRGVSGEERSAWKYIDCSQFAAEIPYSVVDFDTDFVTKVSSAKTGTEFLNIMPQYMDVEFCDGTIQTLPLRYNYETNVTGYGVREPDLIMLENGCVSDVVIDCEAVPNYYKASLVFNDTLNKTQVTEWMGLATKRQALNQIKTSPIQSVITYGVDMTINDNSAVVLNIASMYKDIVLLDKVTDTADSTGNHISFSFGEQTEEQGTVTKTRAAVGADIGSSADNAWGSYETGKSVSYEAKMGTVLLNAEDSAQVLAAMHLMDMEGTFSISVAEFDSTRYKTMEDVAKMPIKVMLQNPLVPYILEVGSVVTKTEVIYTIRYITDADTGVSWQKAADAAAYELGVTLKSIDDISDKYNRLNTQITVGAEYQTNFINILKNVKEDWSGVDTTFTALYTPYGLFMNNVAGDYGYAAAYKLVCDKAGIPCEMVIGTANGYFHTWNKVCIDNAWYNVDVSINDVAVGVSAVERDFRDRCLFVPDKQVEAMYKTVYGGHTAATSKDAVENIASDSLSDYLLNADLVKLAQGEGTVKIKLNDVPSVKEIQGITDSAYSVYITKGGSVDIGDSVIIYTLDGVICYAPGSMVDKVIV